MIEEENDNHTEEESREDNVGENEKVEKDMDEIPQALTTQEPAGKNEYWLTWRDAKEVEGGSEGENRFMDMRTRTKEMKMKQKRWSQEMKNQEKETLGGPLQGHIAKVAGTLQEPTKEEIRSRDQILTGPEEGDKPGWSNILLKSSNPPARLGGRVGGGSGADHEILACKESNAPHNAGPLAGEAGGGLGDEHEHEVLEDGGQAVAPIPQENENEHDHDKIMEGEGQVMALIPLEKNLELDKKPDEVLDLENSENNEGKNKNMQEETESQEGNQEDVVSIGGGGVLL